MDLRHLEYFHHAALLSSFTRAAVRLHVSQSALSQGIKLLETRIRRRLFVRGRRIALTPDGDRLFACTQRVLDMMAEVDALWRAPGDALSGTVRAAVLNSALTHVLPAPLAAFTREHRGIAFDFQRTDPATTESLVQRGDVHFGITPLASRSPDIEGLVLGTYGFVLAVAAGLRRVRLERLLRERPLVVLAPWHVEMLRAETDLFARHPDLRTQDATNCVGVSRHLIAAGVGPGVIPSYALGADLAVLRELPMSMSLYLIRRRDRTRHAAADAFVDHLRTAFDARRIATGEALVGTRFARRAVTTGRQVPTGRRGR